MDGAILVVAATDGTMPQTREHLLLAKQIGIEKVIVFINKADAVDAELVELVEIEIRELLSEFGFDSHNTPVIAGSALQALNGVPSEHGEARILKLAETIDSYIEIPKRDYTGPVVMPIENCVSIPGRGSVVIGTLQRGTLKKGDPLQLLGYGHDMMTSVSDMEVFKKSVNQCRAGDNVGILCRGVRHEIVERGMFVCKPGALTQTNYLEGQIYVLTKEEGGRNKPLVDNYMQNMFSNTWNLASCIKLPEDTQMIMPGDTSKVNVLLRKPMVVVEGQKFTIRENTLTTISGIVTQVLPPSEEQISGFNFSHPKSVKIQSNQSAVVARRKKGKT